MNKEKYEFQKNFAYYQITFTVLATIGASIISTGIAVTVSFGENDLGKLFFAIGVSMIFVSAFIFMFWIYKSRTKTKVVDLSKPSILFDKMYDEKEIDFANEKYTVSIAKKLCYGGKPLQSNYSVLKYAEDNKMILITESNENYEVCLENNIPCVKLSRNPTSEEVK